MNNDEVRAQLAEAVLDDPKASIDGRLFDVLVPVVRRIVAGELRDVEGLLVAYRVKDTLIVGPGGVLQTRADEIEAGR